MNLQRYILTALLCASTGCAGRDAPAPERSSDRSHSSGVEQLSPEQMEALWRKASTPGEAHRKLAPLAGAWEVESKTWMEPGSEPIVSKASAIHSWVLGGRFIRQEFHGTFGGEPYEGIGTLGHDNVKGKYVHTWTANMGTGMMISEGYYDPATRELKMTGSFYCPMTGGEITSDLVTRIVGNDEHVFEMYHEDPQGRRFKVMEARYRRKR